MNNIKIAKQLIKIAKQLIAGYALPGYDKVIFETQKFLSKLKERQDLSEYRFSSVTKTVKTMVGLRNKKYIFSMTMNKKSDATNEFFPNSISIKVTCVTDGVNVMVAPSFIVDNEEKVGRKDIITGYVGDDNCESTPGGDAIIKEFSLCVNNFINKYILLGYQDDKSKVTFEDVNEEEEQSSNFESFRDQILRYRNRNKNN